MIINCGFIYITKLHLNEALLQFSCLDKTWLCNIYKALHQFHYKHGQAVIVNHLALSTYWTISELIFESQFTEVPKKSSQNQRSSARKEENIKSAKVWYRFNGHPKASAKFVKNGRELLAMLRLVIDQAVTHCTPE